MLPWWEFVTPPFCPHLVKHAVGAFLSDRGLNLDKLGICIEDRRLRNASLSVVNNYKY